MHKLKPFFAAAKSADGNALELTVYEDIGADWFGDGITAKTVKEQIDAAGAVNRISLRINSPGGDAFEGVAIYNLLRAQGKFVDVHVDGIAASAASIIAMAGDSITMGPNAMMMIHNAWTVCMGDAADMRKMADVLDRISDAIANTYVARSGKPKDEVLALMGKESWLGAQECFEMGLATAIAEFDREDSAMALAASFPALGKMRRVPEKLRAAAPAAAETKAGDADLSVYEAQVALLGRK